MRCHAIDAANDFLMPAPLMIRQPRILPRYAAIFATMLYYCCYAMSLFTPFLLRHYFRFIDDCRHFRHATL